MKTLPPFLINKIIENVVPFIEEPLSQQAAIEKIEQQFLEGEVTNSKNLWSIAKILLEKQTWKLEKIVPETARTELFYYCPDVVLEEIKQTIQKFDYNNHLNQKSFYDLYNTMGRAFNSSNMVSLNIEHLAILISHILVTRTKVNVEDLCSALTRNNIEIYKCISWKNPPETQQQLEFKPSTNITFDALKKLRDDEKLMSTIKFMFEEYL